MFTQNTTSKNAVNHYTTDDIEKTGIITLSNSYKEYLKSQIIPDAQKPLYQFAYGTTYNTIKSLYNRFPTVQLQHILTGLKPEFLQDCVQEFLTALVSYGIDLTADIETIKETSKAIVYTTKTGKEKSAYHMGINAIWKYIRKSENGTYKVTRTIDGKKESIPCLAIDHIKQDSKFTSTELAYNMQDTEDTIKTAHLAMIATAIKNPDKLKTLQKIYLFLSAEYSQREISEILNIPTSTVHRQVEKIRSILSTELSQLHTLNR